MEGSKSYHHRLLIRGYRQVYLAELWSKKELERAGDKSAAVALLEEAHDLAMGSGCLLRALNKSSLIRAYRGSSDLLRFEHTCHTGLVFAQGLVPGSYQDGEDFLYSWSSMSAILAEWS